MNVPRGTILGMMMLAGAALGQTDGEWSVNRMPGTNRVWTAERTSQEVARVAGGLVSTNDVRLTDARTPTAHDQPAASITNAPWLTVETDATALAALAVVTNAPENRVWIDAPGATNWATVTGGAVVTWGLGQTNRWYLSAPALLERPAYNAEAELPFPVVSGTYLSSAGIKVSGLDLYSIEPLEDEYWRLQNFETGATNYTLVADGVDPVTMVCFLGVAVTNSLMTYPAPLAPIPPYVTGFTALTNWVQLQKAYEAAALTNYPVQSQLSAVSNIAVEAVGIADGVQASLNNDYYTKTQAGARFAANNGGTVTNATLLGTITYTNNITEGFGFYTNGPDFGHWWAYNGTNYWELWK